jgi:hypothetical protein
MGTVDPSGAPVLVIEFLGGFLGDEEERLGLNGCERLGVAEY